MAIKPFKSIQWPGLPDIYTVPQVDDTLTTAGAAADAKKTGDEISAIKADLEEVNDLTSSLLLLKSDYIKWQSGTISGGAEQTSTTRIRSTYLPIDVLVVSVNEGYKYGFHAYENGIRIGSWNGSAIVSSFAWMTTPTIMSALPTQYQYRIVMAKSGDTTIDVSDGANLTATILNDAQINGLKSEVRTGSVFQKSQISGNIVPLSIEARNGYFSKTSSGQISYVVSNLYEAYIIPIKASTKYYASGLLRFIVYLDENLAPTQDAQVEEVTTFTVPDGVKYVAVSVPLESIGNGLIISEQISLPPKMIINASYVLSDVSNQVRNQRYTGAYDSAISLSKYPNTLKKGIRVFLSCDVSTIGENGITVSFYSDTISGDGLKYTVTSTELISQRYGGNPSAQQHGLDIANNIQMMIAINAGENLIKVELTSNGQTYTRTFTNNANPSYNVYPKLIATAPISNVSFSWQCSDLLKNIWAFGDSYFSFDSDKRWTYYLNESGLMDNILIAGFPGDTSVGEYTSLESLVKLGTPKYILWALGMNDGTDSNNTPSTLWMQNITKVLSLCKLIGATPVLATIPTVPTINHEAKNAWIRASGYRYIDFAKAVGADADGHWFGYDTANDMLSSDGVHPSVYGAQALYYRALADFPELAIIN